jgi:ATP/maltotriose-dependent transcriptional regulator MalT
VDLLERADHVAIVVDRFAQLDTHGQLVLISGEAGVGKSSLVRELLDHHVPAAEVLIGRCDDLFAARPLGPLADIVRGRPGPVADALAVGDPVAVFDAFLAELAAPPNPTVVVLEDLQWADEATLDLLRFVARRLEDLPCLVLATHRDDLAPDHPLRVATGSLVGPGVTRIPLQPLSVESVRTLIHDRDLDATALHNRTGGNPFFLVETLAAPTNELPESVRDLIQGRAVRLSGDARDALDAAAVLGHHATAELLQAVGDCDSTAVDECIQAGLLIDADGHQAFRHDLGREAVDGALTPLRRRTLHARALVALGENGDIVQRANHAVGAGDVEAIVDLAERAADRCVALGAWRQAADLYGVALQYPRGQTMEDRLRLLQARVRVLFRMQLHNEVVAPAEEAYLLLQAIGDEPGQAEWEALLSRIMRSVGRPDDATEFSRRSVTRAEALGDDEALAKALSSLSGRLLIFGRHAECIDVARRALELGEPLGLEPECVYALASIGSALTMMPLQEGDFEEGVAALRESVARAKRAGLPNHHARATNNLGFGLVSAGWPAQAVVAFDEGLVAAQQDEVLGALNEIRSGRVEALIYLGAWDEALRDVQVVLDDADVSDFDQASVLIGRGRIQSRRGERGAKESLEQALALGERFREAQLVVPIRLALSEWAWLAGDLDRAAAEVRLASGDVTSMSAHVLREFLLLARRTGVEVPSVDSSDAPTRLILAGDHRGLARLWEERGCPYDAADALIESDDVEDVQRGFEQLTALGARPRARMAERRLRDLGVRKVARGPRASTKANAAGLTKREVEVAALLARGMTNPEIADELILSPKTVDHHVSAVLTKLAVGNRRKVRQSAADLGLHLDLG